MTATSRSTTPGSCLSPRTTAFNPGHAAPIVRKRKVKWNGHLPYLETNLLNGRTFTSLEHLNETAALWLAETADVHIAPGNQAPAHRSLSRKRNRIC